MAFFSRKRQPFGVVDHHNIKHNFFKHHKKNEPEIDNQENQPQQPEMSLEERTHLNLKKKELKIARHSHHDENSTKYFQARRSIFDWLHTLQRKHQLKWQTLLLAGNIIDRYYHECPADDQMLTNLTVATAIFIAAKIEEIYPPSSNRFAQEMGFPLKRIVSHESRICAVLNWEFWSPTPLDFLSIYFNFLNLKLSDVPFVSKVLIDIFLQEPGYAYHYPSEVAAASLLLSQLYCCENEPVSSQIITELSGHDDGIIHLAHDINKAYNSIWSRFSLQNALYKHPQSLLNYKPKPWKVLQMNLCTEELMEI